MLKNKLALTIACLALLSLAATGCIQKEESSPTIDREMEEKLVPEQPEQEEEQVEVEEEEVIQEEEPKE